MIDIPVLIRDLAFFLLVALVVNFITAKLSVPFTLGLVIVGLVIGFTGLTPEATLSPDLVLFVFLPALLFEAGWSANLTLLRENWRAIFFLAGLRRGELMGLKWQDINLDTGVLQVRRLLSRVPSKMPGKGYVEAEPKTQKSRRSVMIAPFALEALKHLRGRQLEAKIKVGPLWQDHDYVFCTAIGTHLNPTRDMLDQLKALLKKAGLPDIRFHDVRRFGDCKIALKGQRVRAITI